MSNSRFVLIMMGVVVFSCSPKADRETLTQVGTIDALLGGIYDGEFPLRELVKRGDLGVGTFNTLNGEMVVLDGQIYQVTSDGKVALVDQNDKTPFAAGVNVPGYHLHFLSADKSAGGHLLAFTTAADAVVKIDETNSFTMILPHDADFYSIDLTADKQADLQKVEK